VVAGRIYIGDVAGDHGLAHGKPAGLLRGKIEKIYRLHSGNPTADTLTIVVQN
jgi:hypothetical protein